MKLLPLISLAAAFAAPIALPIAAEAHTKVVSSTPAEGATVGKTKVVTLNFSEALLPPTVAASLVMTAMPGMPNHGEMAIRNFTTTWSNSNRTMTLKLKQPLRAGTYEVRWQAAGADGHRMNGVTHFVVS
ncbi:copper resistance protein CopC [Novosphingobium aquimarinum]|uniref:copper resistance protein CopC n=1 Tax=Novosphingobium aquimarinum TaxID=2682494 RepID=UPI0012EC38F0|nr:copper resistance protein CopC [Novosphingobium aquimarinum]